MTYRLQNALSIRAAAQDAGGAKARWGIVTSYQASNYTAKVELQPEGILTDYLPIITPMVGPGWGLIIPLLPGQQVLCVPDLGDHENLVILGGTWNLTDLPPVPEHAIGTGGTPSSATTAVQPGEAALVSQAGAVIRFCADGSIYLRGPVNIDGTLRVNGDVYDYHGSLDRLRGHYNAHTHTQPPDSANDSESPTNTPLPQDPE